MSNQTPDAFKKRAPRKPTNLKGWVERARSTTGQQPPKEKAWNPNAVRPKPVQPGVKVATWVTDKRRDYWNEKLPEGYSYQPRQNEPPGRQYLTKWTPPDYQPTYWEDPANVSKWYGEYKAGKAPEWVNGAQLEQAYEYLKYANNGVADTAWRYLSPEDPGREYLSGMQAPPLDVQLPYKDYQDMLVADLLQRPTDTWTDEEMAKLSDPNREQLERYAGAVAQTTPLNQAPLWQQGFVGMTSNPVVGGALQMGALGALGGLAAGGPLGALGGGLVAGGMGAGMGAASSLPAGSPLGEFARGAMQFMDWPYQQLERIYGTTLQYAAPDRPYLGEDLERVMDEFKATWAASGATAEAGATTQLEFSPRFNSAMYYGSEQIMKLLGMEGSLEQYIGKGGRIDPLNVVSIAEWSIRKGLAEMGWDAAEPGKLQIAGLNQAFVLETMETVDGTRVVSHPIDVGYTGMAALVEARRRILAGADPKEIEEEIKARFGVTGAMTDLFYGLVFDPLNIAPGVGTNLTGKIFTASGYKVLGEAFQGTSVFAGPREAMARYGVAVRNNVAGGVAGAADMLNPMQRMLAGLDAQGRIYELHDKSPQAPVGTRLGQFAFGVRGVAEIFTGLTPSSKARIMMGMATENVGNLLLHAMDDPKRLDEIWKVVATMRPSEAAKIAGAFGSPEMYTIQRVLAGFQKNVTDDVARWYDPAAAKARDDMSAIAKATGMQDSEFVKLLDDNDSPADVLNALKQKATQIINAPITAQATPPKVITPQMKKQLQQLKLPYDYINRLTPERAWDLLGGAEGAKAVTMDLKASAQKLLDGINSGQLDPKTLDALKGLFTGKDPAPYSPQKLAAELFGKFEDFSGKYLANMYGLKEDHAIYRFANTMKKAQSFLLLGLNPSYLFNNAMDNMMKRALGGVFGFATERRIQAYFDEIGMSPYRRKAGVGAAGEIPAEEILTAQKGSALAPSGSGEVAIRRATTGTLGAVDRTLDKVSKIGVMSEASGHVESMESNQAMYFAHKKDWNSRWRRNVGFRMMDDPALVNALRQIDPKMPEAVYSLIEGAKNEAQLAERMNWIKKGALERGYLLDSYLGDTARSLGMDPLIMKDTLNPIDDDLREGLVKAKTPEDVRKVFRDIERRATDHADSLTADQLRDMAEHAKNRVDSSGFVEALHIANEMAYEGYEYAIKNAMYWQKVYDHVAEMRAANVPRGEINNYVRERTLFITAEGKRLRSRSQASYLGVLKAWGAGDEGSRMFLDAYSRQSGIWDEYYAMVSRRRQEVHNTIFDTDAEAAAAWNALEVELHEEFVRAQSNANTIGVEMDTLQVDTIARQFGDEAGLKARVWADQMRDLETDRQTVMRSHREAALQMSAEARRKEWPKFYDEDYLPLMQQHHDAQVAALQGLYNEITGRQPPPSTPAPEPPPITPPPSPPTQPGAPPTSGAPGPGEAPRPPVAPVEPPAPSPAVIRAEQERVFLEMAHQAGMPFQDSKGRDIPLSGRLEHAYNVVRKYGGELADIDQHMIAQLPEADLKRIFDAWQQDKAKKAADIAAAEAARRATPEGKVIFDTVDNLPPDVAIAFKQEAARMLGELDEYKGNPLIEDPETGKFNKRLSQPTTTRWYQKLMDDIGKSVGRKDVTKALQRLIEGQGKDIPRDGWVLVQKLKEMVLDRALHGFDEMPSDNIPVLMHFGDLEGAVQAFVSKDVNAMSPDELMAFVGKQENLDAITRYLDEQANPLPDPEAPDAPSVDLINGQRMQAEDAVQGFITRQNVREYVIDKFLREGQNVIGRIPELRDQADAMMAVLDAHAEVWAAMTGTTPERWYNTKLAGVEVGISQGGQRGGVQFLDDGRALLLAFESRDISTFAHEVGHIFFNDMFEMHGEDLVAVEDWLGKRYNEDPTLITEEFAKGFERYLSDGKAPTPGLKGVFDKFVAWISNIYQSLMKGDYLPELGAEMRGVYDRLLVLTDENGGAEVLKPTEPPPTVLTPDGEQFVMPGTGVEKFAFDFQKGDESVFNPAETGTQPVMPGFEEARQVQMKGAKPADLGAPEEGTFFQSAIPPSAIGKGVPPGVVDQIGAPEWSGVHEGDVWLNRVDPILSALQDQIIRKGQVAGVDVPPEIAAKLEVYQNKVKGDLATSRIASTRYAEQTRDFAMLNYSRRRGFDNMLGVVFPYQYWYTRSAFNWLQRFMDKPSLLAHWARLRSMQDRTKRKGYPSRLANKIQIPAPFLPDWAGDSVYVDPLRKVFSFEEHFGPIQQLIGDRQNLDRQTEYMLQRLINEGSLTEEAALEAVNTHNDVWMNAQSMVQGDQANEADFNWVNTIMQPALYLTLPAFMLTGKTTTGREDMNLLPMTRTGLGIEAATKDTVLESVGSLIGNVLAGPEMLTRRKAGLDEFGDWGDYKVDRMLSNLAADGEISARDAQLAMMERSGPAYELARERVRYEIGVSTAPAGFAQSLLKGQAWKDPASFMLATMFGWLPMGLLPEGELKQRGLAEIYKTARQEYNSGNPEALSEFFEKYPEYETRLALFDTPDERLRQFLISEVYDRYFDTQSSLQKQQIRQQLGQDFDAFLAQENHNDLDAETLAVWARMMGGTAPRAGAVTQIADAPDILMDKLELAPPQDAAVVDTYRKLRTELFPNWYAVQSRYFNLPEKSQARRDYLKQFPQLKQYWDWNKRYKAEYPQIEKYTQPFEDKSAVDYSWLMDVNESTVRQLYTYYALDMPMTRSALEELKGIWDSQGRPGDFDTWLNKYVRQGIAP